MVGFFHNLLWTSHTISIPFYLRTDFNSALLLITYRNNIPTFGLFKTSTIDPSPFTILVESILQFSDDSNFTI